MVQDTISRLSKVLISDVIQAVIKYSYLNKVKRELRSSCQTAVKHWYRVKFPIKQIDIK